MLAFVPSTEGDRKGWFGLCLTHTMMRTRSWTFCRSFTHCSTVKNSRLCCRCKDRESVKGQGQQLGAEGVPSPPTQVALKAEVAVALKLPCWDMTSIQAAQRSSWLCKGSFCPAVFQGCQQHCLLGCSTYGNDLMEKSFKNLFTKKERVHYPGFHILVVAQVEEALFAQKWHKTIKIPNVRTLLHSPSYSGHLTKKLTESIHPSAA